MVAWNTTEAGIAIVAGARTPLGKAGTVLKSMHAEDLAKVAIQETLYRAAMGADRLDEVILGNVVMPADAANVARVAALWAGVPRNVPGLTVQRNCASGMEAINEACMRIRAGMGRIIMAGGCESMSNVPLLFPMETLEPVGQLARAKSTWQKTKAAAALRPRHFKPTAGLELGLTDPTVNMIMGKTAEVLVQEFGISRTEQDAYALHSHEKAVHATNAGFFDEEIVPVYAGERYEPVTRDNGPRANTTMESLGKLKPLFDRKDGSVTVGNSCQITDGAATVLMADANLARAEGMEPLGYVRGYAYAALDPARMGLGPVFAIDQLLRQTGMSLADIPLFEINEAFAGQVLACLKAMNSAQFCREQLGRDSALGEIDPEKLNVNGGAIALGHPVGATGARIVLTLLMEMKRRNLNLGLAALCVGGGQGAAMLLERRSEWR
ncbi:MAG TPA: thiolase family protein [Tepidisphaeraceae bacterium]|jgi:acetyl-CoA C-acetyltransferase/acetyl-CoA acyltransferase|nr:thiolase family protein [Tepidisphaeraceae bacterium]